MKYIFYESTKDTTDRIYAAKQKEYKGVDHFHRAFEIAYIVSGKAQYAIEDETFTAEENDIVFAHCYYRHSSDDYHQNIKYVIAVPEKLTHDIFVYFNKHTLPPLLSDKEYNKTLLPFFEKLIVDGENMSNMLAKGYANLIFGELSDHYKTTQVLPIHKSVSVITDILEYIDEHYTENITLESLANHFCYNKAYFSRLFNQHIGVSINSYINSVRYDAFEKMKDKNPKKDITELAISCGFTSMPTFYRIHKTQQKTQ